MKSLVYQKVREFKDKYPMTISWRLKKHSKVIDIHLNPDEVVNYAFAAQKNDNPFDIPNFSYIFSYSFIKPLSVKNSTYASVSALPTNVSITFLFETINIVGVLIPFSS